jgi:hypothetical protein
MDMPIHMIFQFMDEEKKREKERIKKIIRKYVTAPTLLQQILADIENNITNQ